MAVNISNEFNIFCQNHGIQCQFTTPHTFQQNGVCERKNMTLIGVILTMFFHSFLPKSYWGEALLTTNYLQNRCPTKAILENKNPYEVWTRISPTLTHLKIFGCTAYALVLKESQHKLESHFHECILRGYSEKSKAYRFQVKSTKQIIISRAVTFDETSVHLPQKDIPIKLVNQMHDFLLDQNFLKSFIGPP